jgi:hypothetical protein
MPSNTRLSRLSDGGEIVMTKKSSMAKRWEKLRKIPSELRADLIDLSTPVATSERSPSKRAKKFARFIERAFEQTGLDPNNDVHWTILLSLLARAVCGGKGRGQPQRWSKKKLGRLRERIEEIEANNPDATEEECCKILLKQKDLPRMYQDKSPKTLLRQLQTAKASGRAITDDHSPGPMLVKRIDQALRELSSNLPDERDQAAPA